MARVSVDGQAQTLSEAVACSAVGGNMNIAIGEGTTGIAAVVSSGDSPTVQSVGLGNVNGVTLGYQSGTGQGEAKAEKDGNTTRFQAAAGVDMANPMQLVNKPFEIKVIVRSREHKVRYSGGVSRLTSASPRGLVTRLGGYGASDTHITRWAVG